MCFLLQKLSIRVKAKQHLRPFSKRGVKLGVHMSILDLSAHEAPTSHEQKWIQQTQLRQQLDRSHTPNGGLAALPELSRISEVDTVTTSVANLQQNQVEPIIPVMPGSPESLRQSPEVPMNTPITGSINEGSSSPALLRAHSNAATNRLRRVFSRMSLKSFSSPSETDENKHVPQESLSPFGNQIPTKTQNLAESPSKLKPEKRVILPRKLHHQNRPRRRAFSEVLKDNFAKGP